MTGLLTGALAVLAAMAADPDESARIAETYLAAYEDQDFAAMETLYAETAIFVDPTSFDVAPITGPIEWQGRAAILDGIAGWGVERLHYDIDRTFSASGRTVFDGEVTVTYALADGERQYRFPIVTIVTVSGGHVVEHRDYTDYAGMERVTPSTGTGPQGEQN